MTADLLALDRGRCRPPVAPLPTTHTGAHGTDRTAATASPTTDEVGHFQLPQVGHFRLPLTLRTSSAPRSITARKAPPPMTISFDLSFPTDHGDGPISHLSVGEVLFVLGSNGTGKSSLMLRFAANNPGNSRRVSAHRQTWLNSAALGVTPASKVQAEQHIRSTDHQQKSRYRDDYAAQRASITIYELIDAENVCAREIAALLDGGDVESATSAARTEAPIAIINELLLHATIPISINIRRNERLMASKHGGPEYSAAELSDGERNAVLIAGTVLTAPPDSFLIIDEPQRHLHRSIISPLLSQAVRSSTGLRVCHIYPRPRPTIGDVGSLGPSPSLMRVCWWTGEELGSGRSEAGHAYR